MLPKIHKSGVPGRPIVSGCNSPTEPLSQFLDVYLKPIVRDIRSYVKDTTHFIKITKDIKDLIPGDSLLVTFDVKSLYTCIPHDQGIQHCLEAIHNFYGENYPLPLKHIEQILNFILRRNYFMFNNQIYLQIHGTAMGSPMTPNYANIFMARIEELILSTAPSNRTPRIWLRYIDDIYAIWTHGTESLHTFHTHMNSIHETIKFEMSFSNNEIPFLDTLTSVNKHGCLDTSLYKKPTDICSLLQADSFHPSKCKTGMIYSQALRYRRIISNDNKLKTSLQNLQNDLLLKGYNLALINQQFEKVLKLSQNEALCSTSKPQNDTKILPFVVPYNINTAKIGPILHKHWHLIETDQILKDIWSARPVLALQRNQNIKDILVHTNFV